jgi:hypothetical protein
MRHAGLISETPSFRFPLHAGGTEPARGSPREAGGTLRRGESYQSPSQSSQIPARAESPHSLPSPPLTRGERVGVRGDSSPAHSQTLATQLVSGGINPCRTP